MIWDMSVEINLGWTKTMRAIFFWSGQDDGYANHPLTDRSDFMPRAELPPLKSVQDLINIT